MFIKYILGLNISLLTTISHKILIWSYFFVFKRRGGGLQMGPKHLFIMVMKKKLKIEGLQVNALPKSHFCDGQPLSDTFWLYLWSRGWLTV